MKKKLIYTSLLIVIILLSLFALLQFPQLTLRKRIIYNKFEIYAQQNLKVNTDILNALDSVQLILDKSELQVEGLKHRLFLAHGSLYEKLIQLSGQKAFAFSFQDKQIYLAKANFKKDLFSRNDNEYEIRQLVQLIAHESIHNQQYYSYQQRSKPSWINEGYAEYITYLPLIHNGDYQLKDAVNLVSENKGQKWLKSEYGYWDIWEYKYSRVLIEYLIDVKGMTIQEIIADDSLDDILIFEEMQTKYLK